MNGSRQPAVQSPRANTLTLSCPSTRPPPPFRKLSTETTLPLYGICPRLDRTTLAASLVRSNLSSSRRELLFTKLTRLGTGTLLPAAAETPALANKLHPMGHVARGCYSSVHSGMCGLPARHSFRLPQVAAVDFPLRTQKVGVPNGQHPCRPTRAAVSQFGTVSHKIHWQALPHLFGSSLSWLSYSQPGF